MAIDSSSPSPASLSPPLVPSPAASNLNPIVLVILLVILIAFLFSLSLLRHLCRRTPRSTAAIIPSSAATRRSSNRVPPVIFDSPPILAYSSSAGDCAVCLSKIGRRDLLRRLPVCRHGFHAACIDTWLRFNQTCPLCRSPIHGGGAVNFRPAIGSGDACG